MSLGQNSPGRDLHNRYLILGGLMVLGLLVLVVRLYRLQITLGDEYSARSESNFLKSTRVRADRGMIQDVRGEVLVDNRPSFDLYLTPAFCQRCPEEVLPRLGELLAWEPGQLADAIDAFRGARRRGAFQPVPLQIDLRRDQMDVVNAHNLELPGVEVEAVPHRQYRQATVLSHLLGYMNEVQQDEMDRLNAAGARYAPGDYIGRRGLERYFETRLRGSDGVRKRVVNAHGRTLSELGRGLIGDDEQVEPTPGVNVVLSLDMRLQRAAEELFPGEAGALVVVDVRTGFILAMVSRPGFDPNQLTGRVSASELAELSRDPMQPMIYRPVAQHYSPGSTFKPVTALAAFRSKALHVHTTASCGGGYRLGSRTWRCWKDAGHGLVDSRRAMQNSCDVWYYRAGDLIGIDAIAEVGRELGLGERTGLAMVAEVPGIMPSRAYHDQVSRGGYTRGMALNTSTGQGDVNVTPLQLAMAYATLANGGTLYRPQVVRRLETVDGETVEEFAPEVRRTLELDPEHLQAVVDSLVAVVQEPGGTAYSRRLKHIRVAGKTGTAQVVRLGKVRLKKHQIDFFHRDHAWFAAFAPAEAPEVAIVVLNEHGGGGSYDAAPAAMAVLQKYFDLVAEEAQPASAVAVLSEAEPGPPRPRRVAPAPAPAAALLPSSAPLLAAPRPPERVLPPEADPALAVIPEEPTAPAPARSVVEAEQAEREAEGSVSTAAAQAAPPAEGEGPGDEASPPAPGGPSSVADVAAGLLSAALERPAPPPERPAAQQKAPPPGE